MKILLILCVLCSPVFAKEVLPLLTSADGKQTIRAKPIALEGNKIRFIQEGGKTFVYPATKFFDRDQRLLRDWVDAMKENAHAAVVERVKSAKVLRVLFIGNSYSFKIPGEFARLAKAEGKSIEVEQVTKGGWTLAKHANSQATLDKIANAKKAGETGWDIVVLQEQSQIPSLPERQRAETMYPAAKKLADAIRAVDAIPVFFLTWGRKDGDKRNAATFPNDTYTAMQKRLSQGYKNAAKHAGGAFVVPVGEVWSMLREMKKDGNLYTRDGSHPAKDGNYLGACVFYSALYNEKVNQNKPSIDNGDVIHDAASHARLKVMPFPLRP